MLLFGSVVKFLNYSTKPFLCSMAEHISIHRPDAVNRALNFIKSGSIIAVPTETVYGLACDATNSQAIHKLYNVKQRNEYKPVALCLTKIDDICLWAKISHLPNGLLQKLLPGPVTLILSSVNTLEPSLCCNGKIGIRIPDYNFIQKLVSGLGKPLALTSANLSNEPSAIKPVEFKNIWNKIPAVFDGGVTSEEREGSTIIDLSIEGKFSIIRKGIAYKNTINILNEFNLKYNNE